MNILPLASLLLTVSALFAYVNYRTFRLPTTIGVMLISLVFSMLLVLLGQLGFAQGIDTAKTVIAQVDFNEALMHGMLSWLLFAGALHVNLTELFDNRWIVGLLATVGVILSTFIVGTGTYYILHWFELGIPFIYCLLFGALISPTDPVAVMGVLKTAGATKSLETKIAGESLFNDGVAIVVFLVISGVAIKGTPPDPASIGLLFLREAIGGAIFGFVTGWLTLQMLSRVDNYQVEILLTLALVGGGSTLAGLLHISAPIAVVVAGLLIGNQGRRHAMSETTQRNLDTFWELIDEVLNAVLFLLIGLEVTLLTFDAQILLAGVVLAALVLFARFIAVGIPISVLKLRTVFHPHVVKILTWGGLRGGISVALALALPAGPERDVILSVTYIIVVCSIVLQGLTIQKLVAYAARQSAI